MDIVSFLHAALKSRNAQAARRMGTGGRQERGGRPRGMEPLECRLLLSAATKLAFDSVPATGFALTDLAPAITVDVEDAGSQVVTADSSKVTVSVATGPAGGKISGKVTVSVVNGVATFGDLLLSKPGTYTLTVSDGALTAATSGTITISAPPHAATLVFATPPAGNAAGSTITGPVVVDVMDQFGHLLVNSSQVVSLKIFGGPEGGKLVGVLHANAVHGVATFNNLSFTKGGAYKLEAVDGPVTFVSDSFTMAAPAVATSLVFLQPPTAVVAGQHDVPPITVQVMDQYHHLLTTDHSVVKLTIGSGPATHGQEFAMVHNGVATFNDVVLKTAGAYALEASDGVITPVLSNSFNVTAAAADHLAFTQIPGNGLAHAGPFTVKVDVLDKFGNIVTGNTSHITLTSAREPHGATAINTSVQAVAGVATFANVAFSSGGHYVLKASNGAQADLLSKTFTLT